MSPFETAPQHQILLASEQARYVTCRNSVTVVFNAGMVLSPLEP